MTGTSPDTPGSRPRPIVQVAWLVVAAVSAILFLYGMTWLFVGPEVMLDNIAERTSLAPDDFRAGAPSAFDVIGLVSRQLAIYMTAVGLLMLVITWQGYRGRRWAWWAAWVLVAAIAATGLGFFVAAAGVAYQGLLYLAVALIVAVALIIARTGIEPSHRT